MKKTKKMLCMVIAAVMLFAAVSIIPPGAKVYAQTNTDPCDYLAGDNVNSNDYTYWTDPDTSYLTKTNAGYMRVQRDEDNKITVEYYDSDFNRTSKLTLPDELPLFGAFYETENNYFIVSGQTNYEESADVEVFRVTKYDKNWKRLDSSGLYDVDTTVPFDAGSCRIDVMGNQMLIRTGHEMYTSSDGLNHQSNFGILLDIDTMEIGQMYDGYVSHSFNQFVKYYDGGHVYLDHGDAYPRAIVLQDNWIDEDGCNEYEEVFVMEFPGECGDNWTGAAIGGFELTDSNFLIAGTSVKQDENAQDRNTRNIFVSTVSRDDYTVSTKWITDYPEGDASIYQSTGNPYLVKTENGQYLLMWYRDGSVYYCMIDENGNRTSEIYSHEGELSDCKPLVDGSKVIWYTWDYNEIDFYSISLSDLSSFEVISKVYDHEAGDYKVNGKTLTFTCTKCKETISGTIPIEIDTWWKANSDESGYYQWYPEQLDPDETYSVWLTCEEADFDELVFELEDPDMATISEDPYDDLQLKWNYEGKAIVHVYPKYAPSEGQTYEIWVGPIPISEYEEDFWLSKEVYTYNGTARKPVVDNWSLERGTDYTVSYKNNVNAGTATVVITGKGKYAGTVEKTFRINRASIAQKTATTPYKAYHYTGKNITPKVTIKGLEKDKDYTVEYKNNKKVGKATITITGKGNYKGTLNKTFNIKPKMTAVNKVVPGKKQFTVKWQKRTVQVDGYQVRYSTAKTFSSYKTAKVKGCLKGSLKVKNLKAKKPYWVKVRTYKVVNGVTYYSNWSKAVKVTTK